MRGGVLGTNCFYGFQSLEYVNEDNPAEFGGWLPDAAIKAATDWLKARTADRKVP